MHAFVYFFQQHIADIFGGCVEIRSFNLFLINTFPKNVFFSPFFLFFLLLLYFICEPLVFKPASTHHNDESCMYIVARCCCSISFHDNEENFPVEMICPIDERPAPPCGILCIKSVGCCRVMDRILGYLKPDECFQFLCKM